MYSRLRLNTVDNHSQNPRESTDLALFTDPEVDSCFSIYQISWIKMKKKVTFCKFKTSLSRNFVYNFFFFFYTVFSKILSSAFLRFCCKLSMKIIFYLPVNTDKPKFMAFWVFDYIYNCFIYCSNFFFRKFLSHLGSGHKTVNSQGRIF